MAKIFRGKDINLLYAQLRIFFGRVTCSKPRSSRDSSIEAFVVCQDYQCPKGYEPTFVDPVTDISPGTSGCVIYERTILFLLANLISSWLWLEYFESLEGPSRFIIPFLACGDLSAYDSDKTYPLELEGHAPYQCRQPLQQPIHPPYKTMLERKRNNEFNPDDAESFKSLNLK